MTQLRPVVQNTPWKPESDQWNELIAQASRDQLAGGGYFDSLGNFMRRLFKGPPVVPFAPGVTVPAYGVFVATGANNQNDYWVYNGSQATVHGGGSIVLVNGCDDAPSGSIGWAGEARETPVWALYDSSKAPAAGDACGIESGTWTVAKGLPGFICLSVDSTNGRALVKRICDDNTRTAELTTLLGSSGGTAAIWYQGAATSLTTQVTDDMLGAGDGIAANTMITVQFWPHAQAWKVVNAACPAGSS
jgi:hypothetical protein